MTLIEALDEARFVDLTLPIGSSSMLRQVMNWIQEKPELVKELYKAAGLHPPLVFRHDEPVIHTDTLVKVMEDVGKSQIHGVHHKGVPVRVYALLQDGQPYTLREITETLGVARGVVLTAIARWRQKGIAIDFTRPSRTGLSSGTYVMRKREAA